MFTRTPLIPLLFATVLAWTQAAPSVTGYGGIIAGDNAMRTPPPVSGEAYPMTVGPESSSNYLRGEVVFNAAYNDNLLAVVGSAPISDMSYSISPTMEIDKTTQRSHLMLKYSPGFTIYQHTSELNEQSQYLLFDSQYRLSPHITMKVQDNFQKSSNILNQSDPLASIAVSGSLQSSVVPVVIPLADTVGNIASAGMTYQFSRDGMIGASGTFAFLDYPNPDQVTGLYNSASRAGTAFYSHRLSDEQYFGVIYQFSENMDTPVTSANVTRANTNLNSPLLFYTIYPKSTLSLSLLAGPQHYNVSASPVPPASAWTPAVLGSIDWHGQRAGLAASYSREIYAGGGLVGAFRGNTAGITSQWQIARTWGAGLGAGYTNTTNVSSAISLFYPGGKFVSGSVTVHHELSDYLTVEFGYTRLNQNYSNVAALSQSTNSDREYISFSYQFVRPLGK